MSSRILSQHMVALRDGGWPRREPVVCTPLLAEHLALRSVLAPATVVRTGMGPERSRESARRLSSRVSAVLVAGVGGALQPDLRPGDVVVATEIWGDAGTHRALSPSAPLLAAALRRCGLVVHTGAVLCTPRLMRERSRAQLAKTGALAVEMESSDLATICADGPFAAVRVVVDTPDAPLMRSGTVVRGVQGLRALRATAPALGQWLAAVRPRVLVDDPADACDVVLEVGARPASANRQVRSVLGPAAPSAYRVESVHDIDLRWLAGASRVCVQADESAAAGAVKEIVESLSGLGPVTWSRASGDVELTPSREVT